MMIARSRDSTISWMGELSAVYVHLLIEFCNICRFGIITGKLKEMYQMITLGGDAELELVDSLDPFSEGIVFSVRKYLLLKLVQ